MDDEERLRVEDYYAGMSRNHNLDRYCEELEQQANRLKTYLFWLCLAGASVMTWLIVMMVERG